MFTMDIRDPNSTAAEVVDDPEKVTTNTITGNTMFLLVGLDRDREADVA